ncbi:CocE/NonD family hydrolase, partial [bacterium]
LAHDTYDAYWKARSLPRHFRNVHCAVLTVGGWFDKEDMWGALNLYKESERTNRGIPNTLVMGPWTHGQWAGRSGSSLADQSWGSDTTTFFQDQVEFPFFERYLNAKAVAAPPEALVFETGANVWHRYSKWPIASRPVAMALGADETLASNAPPVGERTLRADPANPTPYLDEWKESKRAPADWLIRDQRFLTGRPDVLTWTGPVLDRDLRIGGGITADIWLKSTGTDGDLVVKVIDQFPASGAGTSPKGVSLDGYQMMLRSDVMRMKFRDSFETPKPIVPGQPTRVRFKLNDTLHTFKAGHRVVVQIQPYWFPIVDRNPNAFGKIQEMADADYKAADVTILSGGKTASRVILPTLR